MILRNVRLAGTGAGLSRIDIDDGRIHAVTPMSASADRSPGAAAETVDLDGRWVLPGLWDHHVHFEQWAISRDRHDLSGAGSAAEAAASIRAALDVRPAGDDLFVAVGYRDALWPDRPSADRLDEQTGDVAVAAISADLHAVWLNSAALRRFGSAASAGSARTAGGVLREDDAFAVQLAIADQPAPRIEALIAQAARAAAARGVVGIVDFELPDNGPAWQQRIADGLRSLRVVCSVWPQRLDAALRRGDRTGAPLAGTDGLATMGPLKVIIDGSLNTRTAYCFEPYPGATSAERHGLLTVAPDELAELLARARDGGLNAAVHAIGDHANTLALDAFETAGVAAAVSGRPSTIEHAQLITRADAARMARLGLVASVQPEHAVDDRDVADRYWAGRTDRAFAFRTLADAGVELRLGSDAPVAPLDPWIAIAAAVHRTRSGRAAWHPEQRISITEALRASTAGTAGAIIAGNPADLVVVDHDPLEATSDELRAMPVAATMLAGNWTHRTL